MTNGLADRLRLGTLRFVMMTAMLLAFSERSASAVGQAALLIGWGRDLYLEHCATCHGTDAKGSGPAAATLKVAPPDLTLIAKAHGGEFPREWVAKYISGDTIVAAHGSRAMPIWGRVFEERYNGFTARAAISALTIYIASLQAK
jgi:mono/diheme cytochrome c family protein